MIGVDFFVEKLGVVPYRGPELCLSSLYGCYAAGRCWLFDLTGCNKYETIGLSVGDWSL